MSYPTPDSDNNSFNENSESQKPIYSSDGNKSSTGDDASGLGLGNQEDSLTTGHAGARITCAVIGYSKKMFQKK